MAENNKHLGKLRAVYPIAPAHLQKAFFIIVLSFLFFLAMMFTYYMRQNIIYFGLASAFLLVYLLTLFSWVLQRKSLLQLFDAGFLYKNKQAVWDEVAEVHDDGSIILVDGRRIVISQVIRDRDKALMIIREHLKP